MIGSDRYYIERCLDGHPDDYRFLVQRYKSMIIASLAGRLRDRDLVEEAAHETFVRAYFNMDKLKKRDSFHAWLLGIADRVAREHGRKKQILLRHEDISSIPETATAEGQPMDFSLRAAISALPDKYRKVILLKYYSEKSCNQIAEQLEIPLFTVTKRLSRAYALLRKSLRRDQREISGGIK